MLRRLEGQSVRCTWSLILGFGLACAGCSSWDLRGPGFRDEPTFGRKPDKGVEGKATGKVGFNTKARQIEGNLGVD